MAGTTGEQVTGGPEDSRGMFGPRDPLSEIPSITPRTIRRTMHVDVGPTTDWFSGGELLIEGAARDVHGRVAAAGAGPEAGSKTGPDTLAAAHLSARFDRARVLVALDTDPSADWADAMIGRRAGGGFRKQLAELSPGTGATLVRQLMEDLPAAALISGYASLRLARRFARDPGELTPPGVLGRMTDMCSGWRAGGVAVNSIGAGRGVPFQDCPDAPDLTGPGPDAWHAIPPLAADCMRRRRLVDVVSDEDGSGASLWAMFRDTVGEADGPELVLHEYAVTGRLERTDRGMALVAVAADPKVLPFTECPAAASEVSALAGTLLGDLPVVVPVALFGVASCTHLNDLLRNVGGMSGLLEDALFA